MNERVAILMCASNAGATIREAIDSILSQTYENFEFIIVENGSTDKTWETISSYQDHRIRSFRTELRRLPFNLNYGLIQTNAYWVARMDADDISYPQRIQRQMEYLSENPDIDVLGSSFNVFGEGFEERVIKMPTDNMAIRRALPFVLSICHPTVIVRRDKILAAGGYGLTYSEDLDLWLRLCRDQSIRFANIPESLLRYRLHKDQSKGARESYFSAAAVLFREAFMQSSPRLFVGSLLTVAKYYIGNVRGFKRVLTKFGFVRRAF